MKNVTSILFLFCVCVLSGQDNVTKSTPKTNSNTSLKSINATYFSVGYSSDYDLATKWTLGWSINLGPDFGFFFPFEQRFKEDVRKGLSPFLRADVNLKYKFTQYVKIEFGIAYSPFTIFDVPFLDGLADGNFKGGYLQPWFGKNVQIGWRLSFGQSHINGGDYGPYDSFGLYTSTLIFRVLLNQKRRLEQQH